MLTNQPLKQILAHAHVSRHLVKWAMELGKYGIKYHSWTIIKAQALIDFMAESTLSLQLDETSSSNDLGLEWHIFVDIYSNKIVRGSEIIINRPNGFHLAYTL